ncbi:hypothetical protein FOZ63_000646, partial [Perkinsus olseni]
AVNSVNCDETLGGYNTSCVIPTVQVHKSGGFARLESLLNQLLEVQFREMCTSRNVDSQLFPQMIDVVKDWPSMKIKLLDLPTRVPTTAVGDYDDLVKVFEIVALGHPAEALFELLRRWRKNMPWTSSWEGFDLLQELKRNVYNIRDQALHSTLEQPPLWIRVTEVLTKAKTNGANHTPHVALIVWSRRSVTLMKRLIAMGPEATLDECFRGFLFNLHRHGFFHHTLGQDLSVGGLTSAEIRFMKRRLAEPQERLPPRPLVEGVAVTVIDSRKRVDEVMKTVRECSPSSILVCDSVHQDAKREELLRKLVAYACEVQSAQGREVQVEKLG